MSLICSLPSKIFIIGRNGLDTEYFGYSFFYENFSYDWIVGFWINDNNDLTYRILILFVSNVMNLIKY